MSLISDLEQKLAGEAKAAWNGLGNEVKALGTLIYADLQKGEAAAVAAFEASAPIITSTLLSTAKYYVAEIEKNPMLRQPGMGLVKKGIVIWQLITAANTGMIPGMGTMLANLTYATLETAVQAAFAAMVVGL